LAEKCAVIWALSKRPVGGKKVVKNERRKKSEDVQRLLALALRNRQRNERKNV